MNSSASGRDTVSTWTVGSADVAPNNKNESVVYVELVKAKTLEDASMTLSVKPRNIGYLTRGRNPQ